MAEHASDLVLDALSAGQPCDPAQAAHVPGCVRCSERLRGFSAARQGVLASPRSMRMVAALKARERAKSERRPWPSLKWLSLLALPAAAAAALVLLPRSIDSNQIWSPGRLKGTPPSLSLLEEGESVASEVAPGERLTLVVGAAGAHQVLIEAVGEDGTVSGVWPPAGDASGPLPGGASTTLSPAFAVTPGSAALFAFFSDSPIDRSRAESALRVAVAAARELGRPAMQIEPERLPNELARARRQLCVKGSPCSPLP